MPLSDGQLRGFSEYEEGQEADQDAECPYDGRTNAARAWKLGHTEAWTEEDGVDDVVGPLLVMNDDEEQDGVADDPPAAVTVTYGKVEATEADRVWEKREPVPVEAAETPQEAPKPPSCPLHPGAAVTGSEGSYECSEGHPLQVGEPEPARPPEPRVCPDCGEELMFVKGALWFCTKEQRGVVLEAQA